jgi:hypothetical protein
MYAYSQSRRRVCQAGREPISSRVYRNTRSILSYDALRDPALRAGRMAGPRRSRLLLLLSLLLFLLRQVMSDSTTRRCANDTMMSGDMACYAPYDGPLDASFRLGTVRADQEQEAQQGCGQQRDLRYHTS